MYEYYNNKRLNKLNIYNFIDIKHLQLLNGFVNSKITDYNTFPVCCEVDVRFRKNCFINEGICDCSQQKTEEKFSPPFLRLKVLIFPHVNAAMLNQPQWSCQEH